MLDHVSTRCASYRLLFPSRNIESITPLRAPASPLGYQEPVHSARGHLAIDMRRLLGGAELEASAAIRLDWVSTNQEHRAVLLVDAVDEILSSRHVQLTPLAHAPRRVKALCEGVLVSADGTFRLGIRLDALWPTALFGDRRLWRKSLVSVPTDDEATTLYPVTVAS